MAAEDPVVIDDQSFGVIEDGEIEDEQESKATVQACPIFEVIFRKEKDFKKYGEAIVKVLKQHLVFDGRQLDFSTRSEGNATDDADAYPTRIQVFESTEIELEALPIDSDANCDQNSNDSQDFGADLNKLFTIDPSPSTCLESAKVPSYKRAIKELLDDKTEKKPENSEEACPRPRPSTSCFNCGSRAHGLRECPLPRSAKRINRAKKARSAKGERYHVDVDQRFAHLRPGVISEKLQKALRLRPGEIPSFFYRMRVCGYPPGWLEDAKVSDSGLAMFNSGNDVLKSEENSESKDEIKYNISKIIEFPGFNVSPGRSFYDDYKHFNVPPLSRSQMRTEMISALGHSAIKGFKRLKLKEDVNQSNENRAVESTIVAEAHDMEIEDSEINLAENIQFTRPMPPPLPPYGEEDSCPPPPPPFGDLSSPVHSDSPSRASPSNEERANSPTLDELQEKQRALLLKLECGDNFPYDDDPLFDFNNCADIPMPTAILTEPETPSTPIPGDGELKKIIKSSHMGTPVLQFSPFEKLPSGDNFKVGVSDVINFENLPDSTGKYESMKDVIKKVRNIKKQLSAEDD